MNKVTDNPQDEQGAGANASLNVNKLSTPTKTELRTQLITDLERYKAYGTPFTGDMADHILTLLEDTVREVIGEDVFICGKGPHPEDDDCRDQQRTFNIQESLREEQRQRLVELKEQGASSRPTGSDVRTDTNNGEESR